MNIHKPKTLLRWTSILVATSIIVTGLLAIQPAPARAQSGVDETPEQVLTPLLETPLPPTELPTPESTPTQGDVEPPSPEPSATDLPVETATAEPTASPTATAAETETEEPQTSDLSWSLVMSVPVPSDEVRAMGGSSETGARLLSNLDERVQSNDVEIEVEQAQTLAAASSYQVEMNGTSAPEELRQVIYAELGSDFDFLGGPAQVTLSAEVEQGRQLDVRLESRPGTGYGWAVQSVEPPILEPAGEPVVESKASGPGAPAVETLRLTATGDGAVTVILVYRRPFESGAPVTRNLAVEAAGLPETLDLSSPLAAAAPSLGETQSAESSVTAEADPLVGLPASFDWRAQGKVTPVRNQGGCGGCWAFGTVSVMESALLIEQNKSVDLSEQYLISCNTNNWGCAGGWWAHDFHTNRSGKNSNPPGAVLESQKPYTGANGSCTAVYNHPYKLTNWRYIATATTIPSVDQIKSAIYNHGPVAAAACSSGWGSYTGGVYSNTTDGCGGGVDHAIVLVGWNDADRTWILRNSWGSGWGENGYMRIKWNSSKVGYGATYVDYTAPVPAPAAPPPSNDDFNNAIEISNPGGIAKSTDSKDVSGATLASDDPTFPFSTPRKGNHTVWYRFTTFSSGKLVAKTTNSTYDTILGVYTGSRGSLKRVAWNDNLSSSTRASKVAFKARANTTYYIEVASKTSKAGTLKFTFTFTPPTTAYNSIGSPKILTDSGSGIRYTERRDVYTATSASSDPVFPIESRGDRSVWYRVYPLHNGTLTVKTEGSNYNTMVGLYRAPTSSPKMVTWDDDSGGSGTSSLSFRLAGRNYYWIEVADKNLRSANSHLLLSIEFTPETPVGSGTFDGTSTQIAYLPHWNPSGAANTYGNTLNVSGQPGNAASLTFKGRQVRLHYSHVPSGGYLSIYIDGKLHKTILQKASTQINQQVWTSPRLASNRHTVKVVHRSGGTVNIDALTVVG